MIRVPFVCADDLEIEDPIGYGRNGTVFRVWWKGQAYALKQFDTAGALGLQSYNRELQTYAMLQKAWCVLVPKPVFLSELDVPTVGSVRLSFIVASSFSESWKRMAGEELSLFTANLNVKVVPERFVHSVRLTNKLIVVSIICVL